MWSFPWHFCYAVDVLRRQAPQQSISADADNESAGSESSHSVPSSRQATLLKLVCARAERVQQEFEGWGTSLAWFANIIGRFPDPLRSHLADLLFDAEVRVPPCASTGFRASALSMTLLSSLCI